MNKTAKKLIALIKDLQPVITLDADTWVKMSITRKRLFSELYRVQLVK